MRLGQGHEQFLSTGGGGWGRLEHLVPPPHPPTVGLRGVKLYLLPHDPLPQSRPLSTTASFMKRLLTWFTCACPGTKDTRAELSPEGGSCIMYFFL